MADGAKGGGSGQPCAIFVEHEQVAHDLGSVDGELARGRHEVGAVGPEHVAAAQLGTAADDDGEVVHQSVSVGVDRNVTRQLLVDVGYDFLHECPFAGCHLGGVSPSVGVDAGLLLVVATRLCGGVRLNLGAGRGREESGGPLQLSVGRVLEVVVDALFAVGRAIEQVFVVAELVVGKHVGTGLVGKLHEAHQVGFLLGCGTCRCDRRKHYGQHGQH